MRKDGHEIVMLADVVLSKEDSSHVRLMVLYEKKHSYQ